MRRDPRAPGRHRADAVIWQVPGVEVGHWSDPVARTGCTVVVVRGGAVASGELRGGAPATREFALLDPLALVERIDAVVLAGGSAFGLAAADGVVGWCEEAGLGYPTAHGRVPLVVGLGLYDLGVGDASVRPGPAEGRRACADLGSRATGAVGAGCGATVGSWRGPGRASPGGLVGAVRTHDELVVAALVAVNAWGDVLGHGRWDEPPPEVRPGPGETGGTAFGAGATTGATPPGSTANTAIGVVATNAVLHKAGCHHVARGGHDGLARAVHPPHSGVDGDAIVALATGRHHAPVELVRALAVEVVDAAVRSLADGPA